MKTTTGLKAVFIFLLLFTTVSVFAQPVKRVGIVYSEPSANLFFDKFAYSQLFMAMQHQAMMAGIPYDLLTEDDLTNAVKLATYDALLIPSMQYVTASKLSAIETTLSQAITNNGLGLIVSGNLMTSTETGGLLPGDVYSRMKQWLGISYASSASGVAMEIRAGDINHRVMRDYSAGESILRYNQIWFNDFQPVPGQVATVLATLEVGAQSYNGVLATQLGGRNVHFSNDQILGDTNLVWQALQWVMYGDQTPVGLKLSRQNSIFISRNDMDSSMYIDDLSITDIPLYDLIANWKAKYNFVGSYYLNIGNTPSAGIYTDWGVSAPLFTKYLSLGNEIGTHSWTHPDNTSLLSSAELEFEFNQSKIEISTQLGIDVIGAAIPGNAESLDVDLQLQQYLNYVSGRSGVIGSGYKGAMGRLSPNSNMIYFSLNMSPDYTLIDYLGFSSVQAESIWKNEYQNLLRHASQPIIHWLWHDYGPTSESTTGPKKYSVEMFANTIGLAYANGSEFVTIGDLHNRIKTHAAATVSVTGTNPITASVNANANGVGQFSLMTKSDQIITQVSNWYAYDDDQVFLPENGGEFIIQLGGSQVDVTHITALPMRARLMSLNGDGTELMFSFVGEGVVSVQLNSTLATNLLVEGSDGFLQNGNVLTLSFNNNALHTVNLRRATVSNAPPVANDQLVSTLQDNAVAITLLASDPNADPLTYSVISAPVQGLLSGTAPNLTYTPNPGYSGSDSFTFVASDGGGLSSNVATVSITVTPGVINLPPVANDQLVSTLQDTAVAITLLASDPNADPLTYSVISAPAQGLLSGTAPNLTYTPGTGYSGSDSFTFVASDGGLSSNVATVSISVTANTNNGVISNLTSGLTVDGNLTDWTGLTSFGLDPNDVTGASNLLDWLEGWVAHDASNMYLAFRNDGPISLSWGHNIYMDTDNNAATGFNYSGAFPIGADYLIQGGYVYHYTGNGSSWGWQGIGVITTAISGNQAEFSLPLTMIGSPNSIKLFFLGENAAYNGGTTEDFYPDGVTNSAATNRFFSYSFSVLPGNSPPVANDQLVSTLQDNAIAITLLASDPNADPLTYSVTTPPVQGLLSGTAPNLTYTPNPGYSGSDSFTFVASDGGLSSNVATVAITVIPGVINLPPVANDQLVSTPQDNAVAITLVASDPNADPLTYSVISAPVQGLLSGTAPNLTYTPSPGYSGSDSFTFVASDGVLDSNIATVSITVTPVVINQPPVANDQLVSTLQDTAVAITLVASDPNADPLTYSVISAPAQGLLSGTAPNLTYTPAPGYSGSDSFTFVASDGGLSSNVATVSISVTANTNNGVISNLTSGLTVDGNLTDWAGLTSFGLDPNDVSGASNLLDWLEGWVAHDASNMYLAFRNDGPISLSWGHNIYMDTDNNAATGFNYSGAFPIGADYLIQGGYVYHYTGNGSSWSWQGVGAITTAISGNQAEFSLPRSMIGSPNSIKLFFYGENAAYNGGTTEDFYPDDVTNSAAINRYFDYRF